MDVIQIIAMAFSGTIFLVIIELIRRNYLKERYSLIWLAASIVLMVFSVWRNLLHLIARILGVYYPPSVLFLLALGFLIVLLLHFSSIISSLSDKNRRLAQEIGILKLRLSALEERTGLPASKKQKKRA